MYVSADIHELGYRNSKITFPIYQLKTIECKSWSQTWIQILTDSSKLPNLRTSISLCETWTPTSTSQLSCTALMAMQVKHFPRLHVH